MAISPTSVSVAAALAVMGFASAAHATFIIDTNPTRSSEVALNLNRVSPTNPATTGSGLVGTFGAVGITVNTASSFASGVASITPQGGGTLSTLTFTPESGTAFRSFAFRGQSNVANQQITVTVQDNQGNAPQTFTFTAPAGHANMA